MLLLFKIQDYMERASRGEVTIPPEAVLDFANDCKDSVTVQLNKEKSYKLRMSGLGRPVCQQLLEMKLDKRKSGISSLLVSGHTNLNTLVTVDMIK
jgi:hypothetical protein